jgi:hypothetical protein
MVVCLRWEGRRGPLYWVLLLVDLYGNLGQVFMDLGKQRDVQNFHADSGRESSHDH